MKPKVMRSAVQSLIEDIAITLGKAGALAAAAREEASQGKLARAVEGLLELEPLIWEARGLINAATLLHSRARESSAAPQAD